MSPEPKTPAAKHTRRHASAERLAEDVSYRRRSTTGFESRRRSGVRVRLGRVTSGKAQLSVCRSNHEPRRQRALSDVQLGATRKLRAVHQDETYRDEFVAKTAKKSLRRRSSSASQCSEGPMASGAGDVKPRWRYRYPSEVGSGRCEPGDDVATKRKSRRHSSVDYSCESVERIMHAREADGCNDSDNDASRPPNKTTQRRRRHSSVIPDGQHQLPPLHDLGTAQDKRQLNKNMAPLQREENAPMMEAYLQYRREAMSQGTWTDGRGSWRKLHADLV